MAKTTATSTRVPTAAPIPPFALAVRPDGGRSGDADAGVEVEVAIGVVLSPELVRETGAVGVGVATPSPHVFGGPAVEAMVKFPPSADSWCAAALFILSQHRVGNCRIKRSFGLPILSIL
jgi:hypothetical protein